MSKTKCVMNGHFENSSEVSDCIFPDCKRETCFVYQMKVLGVPVYDNTDKRWHRMDTCDHCANQTSEYCEIKNRDEYGFCGNFVRVDSEVDTE